MHHVGRSSETVNFCQCSSLLQLQHTHNGRKSLIALEIWRAGNMRSIGRNPPSIAPIGN